MARQSPFRASGALFTVIVISCFLGNDLAIALPPAGIVWQGGGEHLKCAQVQVPLDWNRPTGAKITLSVARHLVRKPDQRIGSLRQLWRFGRAGVPAIKQAGEGLINWETGGSTSLAGNRTALAKVPTLLVFRMTRRWNSSGARLGHSPRQRPTAGFTQRDGRIHATMHSDERSFVAGARLHEGRGS
jgi:hypothetical protein